MKNAIPFKPRPQNPAGQQQVNVTARDVTMKPCELCQFEYFDAVVKLGIFSKINPKNPTGQDQLVQFHVLVCRSCGHEYGKSVDLQDGTAGDNV